MNRQKQLERLKELLAQASDFDLTTEILDWDRETYMPRGGTDARAHIAATIQEASHRIFTSSEVRGLLEELVPWVSELDPDSDDARLILVAQREVERKTKIPPEMVMEKARLSTLANLAWREARGTSDWSLFEPYMERIVDLARRMAELFHPYDHIYDSMLDEYEPGMKTAEVQAIFDGIRPQQVDLINAIADKPQVDSSVLARHYPEAQQLSAGGEVVAKFGYDFARGRMDKVTHPFSSTLGCGDHRITYRVNENFLNEFLFAIMHEAGHAMYEQGIAESLARTPLYDGASLAIHESQSRLWENLVGRSKAFWKGYYPHLQRLFPTQVGAVDLVDFYNAINKVEPSLIRVEADEATYNLHIMLRLEIEIRLLEGSLEVKDLPEAWNSTFDEYLGITPENDAQGVLQDVHWSFGLFGYFSTYALGNLVSAQLWEVINRQIPDLESQIERGEFGSLLAWLTENIYRYGKKFNPQELVQRITGSKIDGGPYIRYLRQKFGAIYGL